MDPNQSAIIREIMAAYFSDNTPSDGVEELVFAASGDPGYHERVVQALRAGLGAAIVGDREVAAILRSEVGLNSLEPNDAADFLRNVLDEFTVRLGVLRKREDL